MSEQQQQQQQRDATVVTFTVAKKINGVQRQQLAYWQSCYGEKSRLVSKHTCAV